MAEEDFRPVPGFDVYEISRAGVVRRRDNKYVLARRGKGKDQVELHRRRRAHVLSAAALVASPGRRMRRRQPGRAGRRRRLRIRPSWRRCGGGWRSCSRKTTNCAPWRPFAG